MELSEVCECIIKSEVSDELKIIEELIKAIREHREVRIKLPTSINIDFIFECEFYLNYYRTQELDDDYCKTYCIIDNHEVVTIIYNTRDLEVQVVPPSE